MVLLFPVYMTMTAFGEDIPADCRTAGRDPSPYSMGKPSFLAAWLEQQEHPSSTIRI